MATSFSTFRTQDWNGETNFNDLYAPSFDDEARTGELAASMSVNSFDSFSSSVSEPEDFSDTISTISDSSFNSNFDSASMFSNRSSGLMSESSQIATSSAFDLSSAVNLPSAIAGSFLTTANKEITDYENSSLTMQSNLGLTSEGHSFLAPIHAEIENTNNSNLTNIENTEIGIGSAFGPEGLIAGAALAGVTALAGPSMQQSTAVVNSTSGQLV